MEEEEAAVVVVVVEEEEEEEEEDDEEEDEDEDGEGGAASGASAAPSVGARAAFRVGCGASPRDLRRGCRRRRRWACRELRSVLEAARAGVGLEEERLRPPSSPGSSSPQRPRHLRLRSTSQTRLLRRRSMCDAHLRHGPCQAAHCL